MALSKLAANSFDLTDNYAFTGTTTGVTSTQKLFLIKNIDASSSGTVDFVNGASSVVLDNTYKTYLFRCVNIHPATDNVAFQINFRDGGSNYDAPKTTSYYSGEHLYNVNCATCHGDDAKGNGPALKIIMDEYGYTPAVTPNLTAPEVKAIGTAGIKGYLYSGVVVMPSFKNMLNEE